MNSLRFRFGRRALLTLVIVAMGWGLGIAKGYFPERFFWYGRSSDFVVALNPVNQEAVVLHPSILKISYGSKSYWESVGVLSTTRTHTNLGNAIGDDRNSAKYSPDGKWLAVHIGDFPETWTVYDATNHSVLWRHQAPGSNSKGYALSNDATRFALATNAGIKIWDIKSNRIIESLPCPNTTSLGFSYDGRRLVVAGEADPAMAAAFRCSWEPAGCSSMAGDFHPAYVETWDLSSRKDLWCDFVGADDPDVAFSPDGRYIAETGLISRWVDNWKLTGGFETAVILDAGTGQLRKESDIKRQYSDTIFSPNSRYAALLGFGSTSLIDLKTMKEVRDLRYNPSVGNWPFGAFAPDSRHITCGMGTHLYEWYIGGA